MSTLAIPAHLKNNVDQAFRMMNAYASGKTMDQFARVDPQAVLGEVYLLLAPVSQALTAAAEQVTMVVRPRLDLMPYFDDATWDDVTGVEGVAGPVISLDTEKNAGLYVGLSANSKDQASLLITVEEETGGFDYDFDMDRVVAAAEGDAELLELCRALQDYGKNLTPAALRKVTLYVDNHADVIDQLYELVHEEVPA